MPGYRRLSHNRDFTILWTGETISELGTSLSLFAFPLLAYALSGSALTASVVEALHLLGLCGALLPAGVLADRVDRRKVMLACSATGLVAYSSLAVAGATGRLTLTHLGLVALVGGAATGCLGPALISSIRTVVPTEDLPTALSQNQAREHVASLVGGPLAGVLYAATRWLPFAVDALSFAVSCLTLSRLRADLSAPEHSGPRRAVLRPMGEGFAFIWQRPFFRTLVCWAALANLVVNAVFFVVILRMVQQGVPPAQIGLVSTAAGAGGLLGAAIAPALIERTRTGLLTVTIAWMCALPLVPLIWWSQPVVVAACTFGLLVLNPAGNAGISSYRMAMTPAGLQGRVGSASRFASMSVMPLAPLLGGYLLTHTGGHTAVAALVAATALLAVLVTASRSIRSVPSPRQWAPTDAESALVDAPVGAN